MNPVDVILIVTFTILIVGLAIVVTSNINCVDDEDDYVPTAEKKPSQLLLRAAHDLARSDNIYELASFRLNDILKFLPNDLRDRTWYFFHKAIDSLGAKADKAKRQPFDTPLVDWLIKKYEISLLKYAAVLAEDAGE